MLPRAVLVIAFLHLPSLALATSTGGTTATTSLVDTDFTLTIQTKDADGDFHDLSETDAKTYFNQARCHCGSKVRVRVEVATSSVSTTLNTLCTNNEVQGEGRLYLGQDSGCLSDPEDSDCVAVDTLDDLSPLINYGYWVSKEIPVDVLFGGSKSGCASHLTQYLWLYVDTASDGSADLTSGPSLSLRLDGKPPSAPTEIAVIGGKNALSISFTASATAASTSSDLAGYLVYCALATGESIAGMTKLSDAYQTPRRLDADSLCPDFPSLGLDSALGTLQDLGAPFLCSDRIGPSVTSYRLRGLENNLSYAVTVVAVDEDGNLSTVSEVATGTPVPTVDFFTDYVEQGGDATGGYCSYSSKGAVGVGTLIFLGILAWRWRGFHRWLVVAILFFDPSAQAQAVFHDRDPFTVESPSNQTARNMTLEFQLGPYTPGIDAGLPGAGTPHGDMFGGGGRWLYQGELDYAVFQGFGSLSVGARLGYFRESANAYFQNADGTASRDRSADVTRLTVMPMALLLSYRLDVFAERWGIPLVPLAKAGLNYSFWKVTDGNGEVPTLATGQRGAGGTPGWQCSAGLAFQLDALDPSSMRSLDIETGINHFYLVAEYTHVDASGLGQSRKLRLSDDQFSVGLLAEF